MARCTTSRRFRLTTGRPQEADGREVREEANSSHTTFLAGFANSFLAWDGTKLQQASGERRNDLLMV